MAGEERDREKVRKLLEKADALARDRKFKKAVSVFKQAIEVDPNDIKTRLRLSELLYQVGRKEESLTVLQFVGDYYKEHGFLLKSVAVYRKMVEVDPSRTDLHGVLAQLYFQLGMAPDAIRQFKAQIRSMLKQGRQVESLHVVRSMLELDPSNIIDRLRLAEAFSAHGLIDEAASDYRRALGLIERTGRTDLWTKVAMRYLHHAPEDFPVRRKAVEHLIKQGEHHRALQHLHACLTHEPSDPELLSETAACFEALGQVDKAVVTLKALIPIYRQQGLEKDEENTWIHILEIDPKDEQALKAVDQSASEEEEPVEVELEWEMPDTGAHAVIEGIEDEADTVFESISEFENTFQEEATVVQPLSQELLEELGMEAGAEAPANGVLDVGRIEQALRSKRPLTASEIEECGLKVPDSDREELQFFISAGLHEEALSILSELYGRTSRGGR